MELYGLRALPEPAVSHNSAPTEGAGLALLVFQG